MKKKTKIDICVCSFQSFFERVQRRKEGAPSPELSRNGPSNVLKDNNQHFINNAGDNLTGYFGGWQSIHTVSWRGKWGEGFFREGTRYLSRKLHFGSPKGADISTNEYLFGPQDTSNSVADNKKKTHSVKNNRGNGKSQ